MVRLGLRLAVAGGREAITRLALIAVAVAVGVTLLLTTFSVTNAFRAQDERYAWLETGFAGADPPPGTPAVDDSVDPLLWRPHADFFRGELIARIDLAATGPGAPVPPGIPALPEPGRFYASPALAELLRETPAAELGDRYPGTQVGVIGPDALAAPDSLIIVIGRDVDELSGDDDVAEVTRISTTAPSECSGPCAPGIGTAGDGMTLVLSVVAAALLFPVLIFIGGATRLSAARREQRFAAMRLIGATPRQVSRLATVESGVATVAGVMAGFGLFAVLRPAIAAIPFSDDRFFTGDLTLDPTNVLLVAVGIPVGAAVSARLALRRVNVSPLGVTRRVTPRPPGPVRLTPLVAGVAWLAYLAFASDIGESTSSTMQAYSYLAGVFLIMIGLVIAGPWLTMVGSRLVARRAGRPAGLIAARRLGDDPKAAFRAVSGVVLAVFVASCTVGIITTILAYDRGFAGDPANGKGTVVHFMSDPEEPLSAGARSELTSTPGVEGVAEIHHDPRADGLVGSSGRPASFVSCAYVARSPALGHCPEGADVVAIELDFGGGVIDSSTPMSERTWPAADVSAGDLAAIPIQTVVVSTDGSGAAVERARTVLERLVPTDFGPQSLAEVRVRGSEDLNRFRRLADVVLLTSLPIAGCSLAVSVAGGLADRRRPFSLLRLTGVPLTMLRRVVALEAAVPLLISVVVSAAAGLTAAALFLRAQLDQTLQAPGPPYYLLMAGGVLASLAIIASTFPLLGRISGPESARND
jgi:hypothetical protein